jgi:hypothetical protein
MMLIISVVPHTGKPREKWFIGFFEFIEFVGLQKLIVDR